MPAGEKTIYVYADWSNSGPELLGMLYVTQNRGRETFAFSYSDEWLESTRANISFDPDLYLYPGRQYAPSDKEIFGMFADSCPDRWGRLLMKRREAIEARKEDRKPRALVESDYLLGVYDLTRMGALRFALEEGGEFLSQDKGLAAPPWTSLRSLENASMAFENSDDPDEEKWLRQLLAPGSSLGGARPKASVTAPDGSLWIAKFPSRHDEWNTGAWEIVTHDLAKRCGLVVPDARMENFSKQGGTFLVKRFDREGDRRIHFASAMTLLGRTDGVEDASYLDMAAFIKANGSDPKTDLRELWSRVVFNIAVSNTDDHLRNHGFILTESGWKLSPVYDVNPNIYGTTLSLNITEESGALDFDLALEAAEYFDIRLAEAKQIVDETKRTVRDGWADLASKYGLGREETRRMAPAFEMAYKGKAHSGDLREQGASLEKEGKQSREASAKLERFENKKIQVEKER